MIILNDEKEDTLKQYLMDIRDDACTLFDIHHPLLDKGFAPSKDIIHIVDKILKEFR